MVGRDKNFEVSMMLIQAMAKTKSYFVSFFLSLTDFMAKKYSEFPLRELNKTSPQPRLARGFIDEVGTMPIQTYNTLGISKSQKYKPANCRNIF